MTHLILLLVFIASIQAASAKAKKKDSYAAKIFDATKLVLVSVPQDEEVCFSPDESCDIKLLKFIETAQKSLDIAIYDITLDELVHHILILSKKIPVRIVVDSRQSHERHSLVATLVEGGADIRFGRQRGIMHNKFSIVDGKMIETGSFNYTNHATRANNENQIYLASPKIVMRYRSRFEQIWSEAKPVTIRKTASGN